MYCDILESLGKGLLTDEIMADLEEVISELTAKYEKAPEMEAEKAE